MNNTVSYTCQSKGYGTIFINMIEEDIKQQGLNGIILNTDKGFPSTKFYQKSGFITFEDLIIMGKEI